MIPDPVLLLGAGLMMVIAGACWWARWLMVGALACGCALVLMGKAWA
jgi:hypothetical protein